MDRSVLPIDFRRLWAAFTLSEFGVTFSLGALSVVAVTTLDASPGQVAVIFAVSGLAAALVSFPVGPVVERRRKRPVLVTADIARAITTMSVPLALWTGTLRIWMLIVAMAATSVCTVVFAAANDAHIKALVPPASRGRAYAQLESTRWTLQLLAAPLGGVVVSAVGPSPTITVDAITYVGSALLIRSIRQPDTVPADIEPTGSRRAEVVSGWEYIFRNGTLRSLFANAMLFGGSLRMTTPIVSVLILRELGLPPWQYGLILGVPALGGVIGARLAVPLQRRYGRRAILLAFGTTRTLWMAGIALAPTGPLAFFVILGCDLLLMLCAGVFNPTFYAHRAEIVDDTYMARVSAAWPTTALIVQPIFMIAGAGLVALTDVRTALLIASIALAGSSLLLPWRHGAT